MDVPIYRPPASVYVSSSTECLLQRPGGPRFATQEVDVFGDPYVVGQQVGFRRRSLGTRPSLDLDSEDEDSRRIAPVARRWSAAAMEFGRKHRPSISFRRGSHGPASSPSPPPSHTQSRQPPPVADLTRAGSGSNVSGRRTRRRSSEAHDQHLPTQPEASPEAEAEAGDTSPFHTSNPFTDGGGGHQEGREPVRTRVHKRFWSSVAPEPKIVRDAHSFIVSPLGYVRFGSRADISERHQIRA